MKHPATVPVTLPKVSLPPDDIESEIQEAAIRVARQRTIRLGRDAWQAVQRTQSFPAWIAVGRALQIGRDIAGRASGTTTGRHYAHAFYNWADRSGFAGMSKEARWSAVDLVENLPAIEAWRSTLSEKECKRLVNPLSNCRKWRRSLEPKPEPDCVALAQAALDRFLACMHALPPEQAAPFWRDVQDQAMRLATE
jgi:hypothetical protein